MGPAEIRGCGVDTLPDVRLPDGSPLQFTEVSVGNPHAVVFVDRLSDELVLGCWTEGRASSHDFQTAPMWSSRVGSATASSRYESGNAAAEKHWPAAQARVP